MAVMAAAVTKARVWRHESTHVWEISRHWCDTANKYQVGVITSI